TQDNVHHGSTAQANAQFGASLAAGDFNGDGKAELAIGAPNQAAGSLANAGAVNVLYGGLSGLASTLSQFWTQQAVNNGQPTEANARFGTNISAGATNGDGFAELAIVAPGQTIGSITNLGAVSLMAGTAAGLGGTGNQFYYPGPAPPSKVVGVAKTPTSIQLSWVNNAG